MNQVAVSPLQNWEITTLGNVTHPRGVKAKPSAMGDVPFIGLENIEAQTMRLLTVGRTREVKSSGSVFGKGDVLYGRLRPYLNKVYVPGFNGLASGEFIVFPSQQSLNNAYLQYFLNQVGFVAFAARLNAGDRPRVDFSQLADYPFPLPPLAEQHRIVAEIEKQFTRLDASVAALKRAQANLKRYRASLLKAACEGKLVPTEAELAQAEHRDYEPAGVLLERILAERRARWEAQENRRGKYQEPVEPDISALPDLPEGWVWAAVGNICDPVNGRAFKPSEWMDSGTPIIRIANLKDAKAHFNYYQGEIGARFNVDQGDLLFAWSGTPGTSFGAHLWSGPEGVLNQHIFNVRFDRTLISPPFLKFVLNQNVSEYVRQAQGGVGLAHITKPKFNDSVVPLPPLAEQHRIVAEVDRRLSVIQQAEATVAVSLKRAERLRQSILKQAFSGKLVPQDPNDEPASALLERIRAEREAAEAAATNDRKPRRRAKPTPERQPALRARSQ